VKKGCDGSLPVKNTGLCSQIVFAHIHFRTAKLAKEYCNHTLSQSCMP